MLFENSKLFYINKRSNKNTVLQVKFIPTSKNTNIN